MGSRAQTAAEVRQNLAEQLDWQFAVRNDAAIAQALQQGEPVDAVHTLDEAGLLDGFFAFLQETQIMDHWRTFTIAGVHRLFLPVIYFVLLYGTRVLLGIESTNALPSLLFSNVAVMTLIGFNAWQVAHGLTQRGVKLRTAASEYTLLDPHTLAQTICKASAPELARLFNGTIHCLAAWGVFQAELRAAADGTPIVTTRRFRGCGCQAVTKRKRNRQGAEVKIIELVFGWRLIALIDLVTLIPIAIQIVQIQEHEAPHLLALVQQAQANLAPYSRLRWLVLDRAYVDGPTLYALDQMGIIFTVIAKTDMVARRTALALRAAAPTYERVETIRHGYGQAAWTEDLVTQVVPVTGIRSWRNYRPPKVAGRRLPWAERPALNAVVVEQWRNQTPSEEGPRVYLTNGAVDDPWPTVDAYDDRSWIENGLFRNSKQFWRLTRWFPKKTAAGVRGHLTFVVLLVAVATAYRLWSRAQAGATHQPEDHQISATVYRVRPAATATPVDWPAPAHPVPTHLASVVSPPALGEDPAELTEETPGEFLAHSLLGGQGVARWRRELQRENRDKVIVFIGSQYGIFDLPEFLVLSGVPLRELPPQVGSRADILRRYGCDLGGAIYIRSP